MPILITGAAGFIGSHVCRRLLKLNEEVIGVDNLNDYYDPSLKRARMKDMIANPNFSFHQIDIAEPKALVRLAGNLGIRKVVHLAAQAGVRYSQDNPRAYIRSNIDGHLEMLEFCRSSATIQHLVYASSSSVYGGNTKVPFSEADRVDHPISLYAATKRADEMMSYAYSHLFGIRQTGLRFFTAYGPWGRPDMAYWLFTEAMLAGKPIRVFNKGEMWRDFTYIDDVVDAVIAVLGSRPREDEALHRLYNVGNNKPVHLGHLIDTLENLLGVTAIRQYEDLQVGEVETTYADIDALESDFGVKPKVAVEQGLRLFVEWYKEWVAKPAI